MSVTPNKIDLGAASKEAAKKVLPGAAPTTGASEKIDLKAATEAALKKKDIPSQSKDLSTGADTPISTSLSNDQKFDFDTINQKSGILPQLEAQKQAQAQQEAQQIADKTFTDNDKEKLTSLASKYKVAPQGVFDNFRKNAGLGEVPVIENKSTRPFVKEYEDAQLIEQSIKDKVQELKNKSKDRTYTTAEYAEKKKLENDLIEAENLKKKSYRELTIEGTGPINAIVRTDESGNLLKKTFNRLLAANPSSPVLGGAAMSMETQDRFNKLPPQFATGLNYLKGIEPVIYERLTRSIANGEPISESQVATITAQGIDIEQERLRRDIAKVTSAPEAKLAAEQNAKLTETKKAVDTYEEKAKKLMLTPAEIEDYGVKVKEYNQLKKDYTPLQKQLTDLEQKSEELTKVKASNLLDNKETLRAFISDGVAEMGDMLGKANQSAGELANPSIATADYLLGHTWNYSDKEIKLFGEKYAKENGLDPSDARVQDAIKYLQDNEGWMIMENSIAKAGGIREFGKGLADPIRQTVSSLEDLGKSSAATYAESQSLGNVNASEKRVKSEDTGVKGVLNEVLKGSGQFLTQAGLMYAAGVPIAGAGEALLGKAGMAALGGDIALADMGAKDLLGMALTKGKNPISVFTSSYAMAYDSNLKQALNYTSDNTLAKRAASFNSMMEGATELILSPLEIAEGLVKKFSKGQTKDLLKILSDKSLKDDPGKLKQYATKFLKGVLGTAKVAGAEIGEELVSQVSDYLTNAYLNPNSESFKDRNLLQEFGTTAYQTGLTMAIPAILNGIGSARANTFSKGSLMVAAQNRQKMIDSYKKDLAEGKIDQTQYNTNVQLLNTAAQANDELPTKKDGTKLTTDEKANYIFSRVTEAVMQKKLNNINDAAQKQIINKQIVEQQNYRAKILGNEEITTDPSYKVDGNEVSKQDFLRLAVSPESDEYNFEVTGDEQTAAQFKKLTGVDKNEESPAEQQKADNLELLTTLKDKPNVSSFEYNAIIASPELAYREIADQSLGFTRKGEERIPHEFGGQEKQTREKYGDAIVDKALALYPDETKKTETDKGEQAQSDTQFEIPSEEEFAKGEIPSSSIDAERRFSSGERAFGFSEQDEVPVEINSVEVLNKYTPDQLIFLPKEEQSVEISDKEYNDFIDKGIVTSERLNDIAQKVKGQKPLSDKEKEIFTDKTSEINKIISEQAQPIGNDIVNKGWDKDIESTAKALESGNGNSNYYPDVARQKAEDYHAAKAIKGEPENISQPIELSVEPITIGEQTQSIEPTKVISFDRKQQNDAYSGITDVKNNTPKQSVSEYIKSLFGVNNSGKGSSDYYNTDRKINGRDVVIRVSDHSHLEGNKPRPNDYTVSIIVNGEGKEGLSVNKDYAEINIKANNKNVEDKISELYDHFDEIEQKASKLKVEPTKTSEGVEPKKSSKLAKFKEKHLLPKTEKDATQKREVEQNNQQQHQGTDELQQGEQADRKYEEEDDTGSQEETGSSNLNEESQKGEFWTNELAIGKVNIGEIVNFKGEPYEVINEVKLGKEFKYLLKPQIQSEINKEVSEKVANLEAEKQQKINEITKPEISFDFGIELADLAKTTEANRQKNQDFKDKLASLKNIINCLWT